LLVCFRCDASLEIGSGHVMRCLTLANTLAKEGAECRFVCRQYPGNMIEEINRRGFNAVGLPLNDSSQTKFIQESDIPTHSLWLGANWHMDALQTIESVKGKKLDWLVVDHYGINYLWEDVLSTHSQNILVIDDLADRKHSCDILLDQNLIAEKETRYDFLLPEKCKKLLGPEYALLQPAYSELRNKAKARHGPVRRILIYFGGADRHNITGLALEGFLALGNHEITVDVVMNDASPHSQTVQNLVRNYPNIILHGNIPSLAPLMLEGDLFIGASGATTWERCCLGLPALVVTLAENQKPIAKELDRRGLIYWIGDAETISLIEIKRQLEKTINKDLDIAWSKSCMKLVDGFGANKVKNEMKAKFQQCA